MSTDDARGVERELLAEALHEKHLADMPVLATELAGLVEPFTADQCRNCQRYAGYAARLIEQREAAARAEGRREVREAVEGVLAGGPDTWTGYESRDTGWTFLADSVLDFTADLRAVLLAGQGGESGEGA